MVRTRTRPKRLATWQIGVLPKKFSEEKVKRLARQIELDLCNAVTQGYLSSEGVFLAYRREHLPELPEAVKRYQESNPEDSVRYLGFDRDDGKYTVQIAPSLQWLFSIREMIPNLTFEKLVGIPDPN